VEDGAEAAEKPSNAKGTRRRNVAYRERAATGLLLIINKKVSIHPVACDGRFTPISLPSRMRLG
jgi:hypothetical protein